MASGREIHKNELPPELLNTYEEHTTTDENWQKLLSQTADRQLLSGKHEIAKHIIQDVETILIKSALNHTAGRRHEAAKALGYGRNTLTRKIKELNIE